MNVKYGLSSASERSFVAVRNCSVCTWSCERQVGTPYFTSRLYMSVCLVRAQLVYIYLNPHDIDSVGT